MKLTFLGATQTVTGSKFLIETNDRRILVDCGLFQGHRAESRHKNETFFHEPSNLDAVILSHAHIDHCGNLPSLFRRGFRGPVFCTDATADVADIMLLDSVVARDNTNADAYNWLAYATRKNGDPAKAIPIYEKALTLDPKHRGAHVYIGEAYLMLGDLAKAREHLTSLNALCTFSCSEYRDLKKSIEAYEKNGGKSKPAASR